ncbi:uberolysin/carnocyclin family circular bacteriocin [uncultured Ligilactobacillus sp.]|uniref:uberolysin/carnocyclin family circular bacteriocin n=1 Tax=uncultured Ligilactobacillus sp. TaxID=2837633 RepID=UPI00272A96B4|nr:uberolysin/carnocyclin family circular bacteriocin [uncultured Ligilactobacillus sp.]
MQLVDQNKKRVTGIFLGTVLVVGLFYFGSLMLDFSHLAVQFGISTTAAEKIINIASGAGSIWAIIAVVGGSAGWGAALLAAAKVLIKRYGKKAAVSW